MCAWFEASQTLPVSMTSLSLFTFLLLTPAGWAATYLGLSGFIRALSCVCLDPCGDPVLTAIDWVVDDASRKRTTKRAATAREALEGPEVPDRVIPGSELSMPDAELVIVASRRKPGWDRGTVVITENAFYRVGTVLERQLHGRLRTLYPLNEHNDLEVFRRTVRYDMPASALGRPEPRHTS